MNNTKCNFITDTFCRLTSRSEIRESQFIRKLPAMLLTALLFSAAQAHASLYTFRYTGLISYWTVPQTGIYSIFVAGGAGGDSLIGGAYGQGGGGGIVESSFWLFENQVLEIWAASRGGEGGGYGLGGDRNGGSGIPAHIVNTASGGYAGGGGGSSYVSDTLSHLLIVAGGGGGGGNPSASGGGGGGYLHAGGQSVGGNDYVGKTYAGGFGASDAGGRGGDGGDPTSASYIQAWYAETGYGSGSPGIGYSTGDNVLINFGGTNSGDGVILISYLSAIPEPSTYGLIFSALVCGTTVFLNRKAPYRCR